MLNPTISFGFSYDSFFSSALVCDEDKRRVTPTAPTTVIFWGELVLLHDPIRKPVSVQLVLRRFNLVDGFFFR